MGRAWEIGGVPIAIPGKDGSRTKPEYRMTPGWITDLWGLDWRTNVDANESVWHLTHLPTGFSVCSIAGKIDEAKAFTAELEAAADWNFTKASESKSRAQAFADARKATTFTILRGTTELPK